MFSFCTLNYFRSVFCKISKADIIFPSDRYLSISVDICQTRKLHKTSHYFVKKRKDVGQILTNYETDDLSDDLIDKQLEVLDRQMGRQKSYRRLKPKYRGQYDDGGLQHVPVMRDEVLQFFVSSQTKLILDMTFGAGGHTRALLDAIPGCHVLALDRDPGSHSLACQLAEESPGRVTPILGRFSDLPHLLPHHSIAADSIDGALFDLGSSSMQFDQSERGFSLSMDGPLDMRMDGNRQPDQPTAADVVNSLDEIDLSKILKKYGEERRALKIAHGIVEAKAAFGRISTTRQLADIIESVCGGSHSVDQLDRYSHPATKTFMALRIFVNNEMNELNCGLELVHKYLKPGGVCVAIAFHSLEDRIVKRHFHSIDLDAEKCLSLGQKAKLRSSLTVYSDEEMTRLMERKWKSVNKKVMVPSIQEVERNPRSRSAKLRAAIKNR